MHPSFVDLNLGKIKRTNTIKTGRIYSILVGIGSALVVCINSTLRAKIVLCFHSIKLIESQCVFSRDNLYILEFCRHSNGASHTTIGTIASTGCVESISKPYIESHSSTVASTMNYRFSHVFFLFISEITLHCTYKVTLYKYILGNDSSMEQFVMT